MAGDGAHESSASKEPSPTAALGFEYTLISPNKVSGRLKVVKTWCQPFNVLHGGVSYLMAEAVASMGAFVASGFRRVAGVQLSANNIKAALLGEEVEAEATPIQVGKTIQVWEVQIRKIDPSTSTSNELLSTSRVTLLCSHKPLVPSRTLQRLSRILQNYDEYSYPKKLSENKCNLEGLKIGRRRLRI